MTRQASTVIVGDDVWGSSITYHLARAGKMDVQVMERNGKLFDETTSQAARLVGPVPQVGVSSPLQGARLWASRAPRRWAAGWQAGSRGEIQGRTCLR